MFQAVHIRVLTARFTEQAHVEEQSRGNCIFQGLWSACMLRRAKHCYSNASKAEGAHDCAAIASTKPAASWAPIVRLAAPM